METVPAKGVTWFGSDTKDFETSLLHTLFVVENYSAHRKNMLSLHDPVFMSAQPTPTQVSIIGMGEVVAVKQCCIGDLDRQDLVRNKGEFKTIEGTLELLRQYHSDFPGIINRGTIVTVYTIRRPSYDLKPLANYVKPRLKPADLKPKKVQASRQCLK